MNKTILKVLGTYCAGMLMVSVIQAADLRLLGELPGSDLGCEPADVSDDGSVVVGTCRGTSGEPEAFRWTSETGMVGLGDLPGGSFSSTAYAVSADGSVVVGESRSGSGREAFRWASATGMVGLGALLDGNDFESIARDVSADGSVIVGSSFSRDGGAFRWTSETGMVDLGNLPPDEFGNEVGTAAMGVSADGDVVVGEGYRSFLYSVEVEAFRWTAETGVVSIDPFPTQQGSWSGANDVSADGSVIVGYADHGSGNVLASRWTLETGMVELGSLPGSVPASAFSTSGDGNVVVGRSSGLLGRPDEAFIWTQSAGVRKLLDVLIARGATGLEGWSLGARAISANGRWVVGTGGSPTGEGGVFLADLLIKFNDVPPEHWAIDFVHKFADSQISRGCSDGNFCPDNLVTRAQMAVYLERGMRGHDFTPQPAKGNVFADVAAGDFGAAFIEQLSADGITGGCGSNNYCPGDAVTRAQMAVFLLRAKHGATYTPPPPSGTEFGDVDSSHWAVAWIEQLAAEGITGGCGDGNFCPNGPVTRAHMAVFMVRTFGL